jgi:hypothetical protein
MRAADASLLIIALCIAWSLYRAHRNNAGQFANFNLLDLIMDNGRISRMACVFLACFGVLSWIMVRLTIENKMTEGYFMGYAGACFAPIIARLFSPAPASSTLTATTTATVTEKTVTP